MDSTSTNPVQPLRERATCLEAAISVSLAEPTRKAVHELRSETRRIEAQLDLLRDVSGLPSYREQADALRRRLRKLRRLAGDVRDCDVQCKLLKKDDPSAAHREAEDDLQKQKDKLTKVLKQDREDAEDKLARYLRRQQPKLARSLEEVLEALKPSGDERVEVRLLLEIIERGVARSMRFRRLDEERLHDVRKAAKLARYQCEMLPGDEAAAMAKRLEDLQDEGGAWHDYLVLAERASSELGEDHSLPQMLERRREQHLNRYLKKLEALREDIGPKVEGSRIRPKLIGGAQSKKTRNKSAQAGKRPPQRETEPGAFGSHVAARKMSA